MGNFIAVYWCHEITTSSITFSRNKYFSMITFVFVHSKRPYFTKSVRQKKYCTILNLTTAHKVSCNYINWNDAKIYYSTYGSMRNGCKPVCKDESSMSAIFAKSLIKECENITMASYPAGKLRKESTQKWQCKTDPSTTEVMKIQHRSA